MRSLLPDGRYVFDAADKIRRIRNAKSLLSRAKIHSNKQESNKKKNRGEVLYYFTKAQTVSRGLKNVVINAVIISIYPRFTAYRALLNSIKIARIDNDNGKNIKILF